MPMESDGDRGTFPGTGKNAVSGPGVSGAFHRRQSRRLCGVFRAAVRSGNIARRLPTSSHEDEWDSLIAAARALARVRPGTQRPMNKLLGAPN